MIESSGGLVVSAVTYITFFIHTARAHIASNKKKKKLKTTFKHVTYNYSKQTVKTNNVAGWSKQHNRQTTSTLIKPRSCRRNNRYATVGLMSGAVRTVVAWMGDF